MALPTKYIQRSFTLLALAALLALFPPGPTRTLALAQSDPPTALPFHLFLPLGGNTAPAPDLIFTPDSVQLTPGAQASVTVRVEPQADLSGASFELPGVQDGVSSRFEAAPDGTSGTLTIEASTAAEASERALMVQGRSGDGSKGWVGRLKVTTRASITAQTFFVNSVTGKDSNDGSQAAPFKTLTKALSVAKSGDTVKLAPGVYSKSTNGEPFSTTKFIIVPSGVTIEGSSASDRSILQGASDENALFFQGDARVTNLAMQGFANILFAGTGKQTFSNLVLSDNARALSAFGSAQVTLVASQIKIGAIGDGLDVRDQAQLVVDGGSIKGPSGNCETRRNGVSLLNSAQVTLKNEVQLVDVPGKAIAMRDISQVNLVNVTVTKTNPACTGTIGIEMLSSDFLSTNQMRLHLKNTTISGYAQAGVNLDGNEELLIDGGIFKSNGVGINASTRADLPARPLIIITGVLLTSNQIAVNLQSVPAKFRGNTVTSNGVGIKIAERNNQLFFLRPDLGTAQQPGGNTITGNTTTGVMFDHIGGTLTAEMFASGNFWNLNTQAAGSTGQYSVGFLVTADRSDALARGKNFFLVKGSSTSIQF